MALLRIELSHGDFGPTFELMSIESDRWQQFGFGTFLSDVEKDEVEITKEALDELLNQKGRPGLQGLEFWPERRLAWGSRAKGFSVPASSVNVPEDAKPWIKDLFSVIEES